MINSTGQINVDFADVCTVMRNGGVAILGSATAKGDSRAQKAIEEALNSPLLNDNDISGAKWILININSSEGEHEFTMDEVDIIQNHLLGRAGEHSDVILGLGYDNALGSSLGITLIATGFEHKDPFSTRTAEPNPAPKKEEKILMTLNPPVEENPTDKRPVLSSVEISKEALNMKEPIPPIKEQEPSPVPLSVIPADPMPFLSMEEDRSVVKSVPDERSSRIEWVLAPESAPLPQPKIQAVTTASKSSPASAASGGYLARPSNIYAEDSWNDKQSSPEHNGTPAKEPTLSTSVADPSKEEDASPDMQLVFRDTDPTADEPGAHQTHSISVPNSPVEEPAMQDDADDLKRRAAERINKLRNLSFNVNAADPNNEFETVPAYIRRNLELYNTISNVENFYSNYEVKTDENNNTEISTINTFLDGKRPD